MGDFPYFAVPMMGSVKGKTYLYSCRLPVRYSNTVHWRHRIKPEAPSINIINQRVAHAALTCTTLAMDLDVLTTYRLDLADEGDDNNMDWDMTATAAATIVVGARQRRAEQRMN
ncbi:hypothetical protein B0H14DRAFT_3122675 [Mycena olivaceomarginata]|nr:hypothetical protein B0H14DRAFT_3122675 [Mycena olivaceomarginata]